VTGAARGILLIGVALVVGGLAWPSGAGGPAPAPFVVRVTVPSVVRVITTPGIGPAELATGFEPRPGRVVTVAHVLDGRAELAVRGADGARRRAHVLRVDRRNDLALLAVAGGGALPPGGASGAAAGDRHQPGGASGAAVPGTHLLVRRAGHARALPVRAVRRLIARVQSPAEATSHSRPVLELAVDVRVGDSGAPVVQADGRVLGILFARSRTRTGKAYAVDGAMVPALLSDGIAAGAR
jgi:S1-C subfamily serine protease